VGAIENYTESTIKEMCNTFDKATIPVDSQELLGTQSAVGLGTVWGSNIAVNYLSRSVVLKESSKIGSTVTRVVDIKLPKSITEADSNLLTLNSLREKTDSDIVFHSRTKKELKQQEAILRAERMSVEEQVGIILGRNRVLTLMADHAESRRQRIENNEIIRNLRKPQSEKEDEVNEQIKAVDLVLESHFDILGLIVLKIGINNKFKMQDRSLLQRGFDAVTTPYTTASKFASNVSSSNPFDFFGTNKSGGKTRKNKNKNKRNSRRRHKNKRNSKRRTRK
jgi:hypothetical protein